MGRMTSRRMVKTTRRPVLTSVRAGATARTVHRGGGGRAVARHDAEVTHLQHRHAFARRRAGAREDALAQAEVYARRHLGEVTAVAQPHASVFGALRTGI